jgi:hypothetical protein
MNDIPTHIIYDCITKQEIMFYRWKLTEKCKELGLDGTIISRLKTGKYDVAKERYIMSDRKKELIFTLVDISTNEEFECVSNKSIFIHLNYPYNENDSKYLYELKSKRQTTASICDRIFYIKEYGLNLDNLPKSLGNIKVASDFTENFKMLQNKQNRMRRNFRTRLNSYVRVKGARKFCGMQELLGCSKAEFIKYIEDQFDDKMSWDNYGSYWHIDHIMPCFTFNFLQEDQVRECWHHTNLRPLSAKENLARSQRMQDYRSPKV